MTNAVPDAVTPPRWVLRLYVNGASPNSVTAIRNLQRICEEKAGDAIELEVIDIQEEPALVVRDNVVAAPTLVRELPEPLRHIVGDFSDLERIRNALDLGPLSSPDGT